MEEFLLSLKFRIIYVTKSIFQTELAAECIHAGPNNTRRACPGDHCPLLEILEDDPERPSSRRRESFGFLFPFRGKEWERWPLRPPTPSHAEVWEGLRK